MKKKTSITEKMGIQKEWYEQSKEQTTESLPKFIKHLMEDYNHDYGTICHALTAGGLATIRTMNKDKQGGITGFQAGAIMWEFIQHWNHTDNKAGMKLINYDDLLYPQYKYKFDKTIKEGTWKLLKREAKNNLKANPNAHPKVKAHWQSIADEKLPFGFTISEE